MRLSKRISAIEAVSSAGLSNAARRWLGLPAKDDPHGEEFDPASIDTSTWSQELKAWLGVD